MTIPKNPIFKNQKAKIMPRTLIVLLISLLLPGTIFSQDILDKLSEIAIIDQKVMMPMRDGIRLATDILFVCLPPEHWLYHPVQSSIVRDPCLVLQSLSESSGQRLEDSLTCNCYPYFPTLNTCISN